MMHDCEKSHSAIVAAKPTNKAGSPAAEPVEPRAGTERNAGEQSTHRTQSRVRVSQALDRVRQAARLRKKEKFTSASICSRSRSSRSNAMPHPAWTG